MGVKVLEDLTWLREWLSDTTPTGGEAAFEVATNVRAAVAELIEAADEASVALGMAMKRTHELCTHMRLCAALARVQGGAA